MKNIAWVIICIAFVALAGFTAVGALFAGIEMLMTDNPLGWFCLLMDALFCLWVIIKL